MTVACAWLWRRKQLLLISYLTITLSRYFSVILKSVLFIDSLSQRDMITNCFLNGTTAESFNQLNSSIYPLFTNSINEKVDNFHSKILDMTDSIAPIKVKVVSNSKKSLRRNDPQVRSAIKKGESKSHMEVARNWTPACGQATMVGYLNPSIVA